MNRNVWIVLAVLVFAFNGLLLLIDRPWETGFLLNLGLALFALGHIDSRTLGR